MQAERNICREVKCHFFRFINSRSSGACYLPVKYLFVCGLKRIFRDRKSQRVTRRIQDRNCKDISFTDLFIDDAFI